MIPYRKILITGGAGFVGSALALKLKEKYPRLNVLAIDNLKRRGSELNLQRLAKAGVGFRHADIRNKGDFEGISCDLLIECSAEASCVAGLGGGLDYLVDTNFLGTLHCLEFAARLKSDFIFLSSSRVYPFDVINNLNFLKTKTRFSLKSNGRVKGVSSKGIAEDFPLKGVRTFYGASKLSAEFFIQEYRQFRSLKAVVNRCGLITGPWQMGKMDQGIVTFWLASHMMKRPLKYFGWAGKQVRDFIHIDDLFILIDSQLKSFDKINGEVFNIGGGERNSFSLIELTQKCRELTGNKLFIGTDKQIRPGDVCWYVCDISKIHKELKWIPTKNLDQTLESIESWIAKNFNILKGVL